MINKVQIENLDVWVRGLEHCMTAFKKQNCDYRGNDKIFLNPFVLDTGGPGITRDWWDKKERSNREKIGSICNERKKGTKYQNGIVAEPSVALRSNWR